MIHAKWLSHEWSYFKQHFQSLWNSCIDRPWRAFLIGYPLRHTVWQLYTSLVSQLAILLYHAGSGRFLAQPVTKIYKPFCACVFPMILIQIAHTSISRIPFRWRTFFNSCVMVIHLVLSSARMLARVLFVTSPWFRKKCCFWSPRKLSRHSPVTESTSTGYVHIRNKQTWICPLPRVLLTNPIVIIIHESDTWNRQRCGGVHVESFGHNAS